MFAFILCAALGAGLTAGVFFAFSTFVMPALARLPPHEGIAAMQSINIVVLNRWFLGVFVGTGCLSIVLAVAALVRWSSPGSAFLFVGAVLYCAGTIAVTRAGNIPLNDALAAVSAEGVEGAALWARYLQEWMTWNHVRCLAALAASASFILALGIRGRAFGLVAFLTMLTGCGALQDPKSCAEPSTELLAQAPATLSATGLFVDASTDRLEEGVVPYRPRFELWSDGATKRRWVSLPPGATIDTSDMDAWQFPKGTKFWKEFTRDGVRVETRFLQKVGDAADAWLAVAYVWNANGSDAIATPAGRTGALGTQHDVPPARHCMGCHGGTASRVLGFSAIQLATESNESEMTLERLDREHRLSHAAPRALAIPGDATTQAALGYLHANCSHCHNTQRPKQVGPRCFDPRQSFDLALRTSDLGSTSSTAVYRTGVGRIVSLGAPDQSTLLERMTLEHDGLFSTRMPALGTRTIDTHGVELLRTWIRLLALEPPH